MSQITNTNQQDVKALQLQLQLQQLEEYKSRTIQSAKEGNPQQHSQIEADMYMKEGVDVEALGGIIINKGERPKIGPEELTNPKTIQKSGINLGQSDYSSVPIHNISDFDIGIMVCVIILFCLVLSFVWNLVCYCFLIPKRLHFVYEILSNIVFIVLSVVFVGSSTNSPYMTLSTKLLTLASFGVCSILIILSNKLARYYFVKRM